METSYTTPSSGGLGLRQAHPSAPIAFLASCYASCPLAKQLLAMDCDQDLVFPGKDEARAVVEGQYNLQLDNLSQPSLQAQLDNRHYEELLNQHNIRDKARLHAISESNDSSAWLRVAPMPNLGLSMHNAELVIALRIWLGLPIFTESACALCSCKTPIDAHGDHLLGSGFGSLRIRRHDALCSVLWHALSQDNPDVKREQRSSGDSQSRPGDIYHPDYAHGLPTFSMCQSVAPFMSAPLIKPQPLQVLLWQKESYKSTQIGLIRRNIHSPCC